MIKVKLQGGDFAYVQDGVWHAGEKMTEQLLRDEATLPSTPGVGDLDYAMAQLAVHSPVIQAEIITDDGMPDAIAGDEVY